MKKYLALFFAFNLSMVSYAQVTGANEVRKGNELYEQGSYEQAQSAYQRSLQKGSGSLEGAFNLGDALYKQEKYKESAAVFKQLAEVAPDKKMRAQAFHNLGNSLIKEQQLKEGIEAYKNALRNNPMDEDTRHNLSWAMRKMKEQEKKQDQNKDQQKDQQDKEQQKDQQKKDQEKKEQEKQDQQQNQNKEKQEENQQQQKQPERPDQLSKEEAQRMLDALNNEEKNLQQKLKKKKAQSRKVTIEKDW